MGAHPKDRRQGSSGITRREFLRRSAMAGIALPSAAAILAACSSDDGGTSSSGGDRTSSADVKPGGTLRIGQTQDPGLDVFAAFTQQEQHWCCLNRNLYTYTLTPISEGGGVPVPDIATGMPEISADGRTYTVHLKRGLHYSPPYADREIVAGDFVRTLSGKLLSYAIGRGLEYYDLPAVRKIARDAAKNDYRWSAIISGIVTSTPLSMGIARGEESARR